MLADGLQSRRPGADALSGMGAGRYHAPLRGRDQETQEIERGFRLASSGDHAVSLLSGDPGIGKTRLLQHALQRASDQDWMTMVVAPDIDSALAPLGALIGAATRTEPPLLTNDGLGPLMQSASPKYWLTRMIADGLENTTGRSGALVVVDDLQWLDAGSLGVLTSLIHDLPGVPIYWLLATRTGSYSAAHQRFVDGVRESTPIATLSPLDPPAVEAMVRDALGSRPGPRIEHAVERAAGYPLLVLELIRGLQEEGLLRSDRGIVDLDEDTLPARFGTSARDRLRHISRDALRIAQIGSLYGRDFPLGGVLDVLGRTASAAAPAVQELLDLGFIIDTGSAFAFRHDTVQAAACESLSPSLRRAMTREVIHRRLRAGEGVATLATSIVSVAEAGDDESIELLFRAAEQLSSTDVHGAAGLVVRGAQLTAGNPAHIERAAALLPLVLAGGLVEEALEISRSLKPLLSPDSRARVSLALARQLTESDFESAIRETTAGLDVPGISDETRIELLAVRALNFANQADEVELRRSLTAARAVARVERDVLALSTIDATESVLVFYQGDFDEAERLQRRALDRVARTGTPAGLWLPEGLWMAFMRNSAGGCIEALRMTDDGVAEARAAKNVVAEAYWMMVRARALYDLGRLDEARTQAEAVLQMGGQLGLGDFMNATAGVVLHRVAIRTGDVGLRNTSRPLVQKLADGVGPARTGRWSLALEAMDREQIDEAYSLSDLAIGSLHEATPSMTTPEDFHDYVSLALICVSAGDHNTLQVIDEVMTARAESNPTNVYVGALAQLVHGIRTGSVEHLHAAVADLRSGCRPLVTAAALEALGTITTDKDVATAALTEAVQIYNRCGATRDASRQLHRLRRIGARLRPSGPSDDATGLSQRERQVATFIHAGLTTQQIANELLVSPHTVVTYVRHIYSKWGVNTRREVARRVNELEWPG